MSKNIAHLISAFSSKGKKGAMPEESDEDENDQDKIPANDKEDGKKGSKKGKKAGEGSDDDEREEEDSEEGESEEDKETRDEDEEDDEEDDLDKKRNKKARKAERNRIAKILGCAGAQANPQAAFDLALKDDMPAVRAVAFLNIMGNQGKQTRRMAIDERMSTTKSPSVGMDATQEGTQISDATLTEAQMAKMTPAQKALLISASGSIRRGEAVSLVEGLKKLG